MKPNWIRNVVIFLSTQTVSLLGSMLVNYAIMWYVTLQTQSGLMMMIQVLAYTVPSLILAPFAGVWADKFNRKLVMVFADGFIAVVTLLTAVSFILGYAPLWMIFVVSAVRSVGQSIHQPSVSSTYQEIVPKEHLMRVNGINQTIQSSLMIVLPILAAFLLSITDISWIFMIDVVTAAIAIASLVTIVYIPKRAHEQELHTIDYFSDVKAGVTYIKSHHYLIPFFVVMTFLWILISPVSFLTPLQTVRNFGDEVWRLSAIEIGFAIGMTLGGLLIATWGGFKNRAVTMLFGIVVLGVITVGFGITRNFPFYIFLMGATGLFIPIFNAPAVTMLQEQVDPEYTGRVFSVMGIIQNATMPVSMLFFGPLADIVSIDIILIITGALISMLGYYIYANKAIMKAGLPRPKVTAETATN